MPPFPLLSLGYIHWYPSLDYNQTWTKQNSRFSLIMLYNYNNCTIMLTTTQMWIFLRRLFFRTHQILQKCNLYAVDRWSPVNVIFSVEFYRWLHIWNWIRQFNFRTEYSAQVNFSGPKIFFTKFWSLSKLVIWH